MAVITKEIQDYLTGKLAWVATADKKGIPNLAPKGTLACLDEQTLVFADIFSNKTRTALEENPNVAVAVIDPAGPSGYQFKGQSELLTSGPIYDQVTEKVKQALPQVGPPKYVVKITVNEVYSLAPGPDAGRKLG
ncbi:MAG: pyridoxamine 5'-phosphate oxidase family protein [Deltaproteobacteria bacterium]|jgi:predicted pyridoxine 5'-phosphate oxidase superfamily flavin-nucleotide-binding protein|nr:pyridoxamine 5'-phosphate oxidase family protein [Deltaproteobacteria bacterium]